MHNGEIVYLQRKQVNTELVITAGGRKYLSGADSQEDKYSLILRFVNFGKALEYFEYGKF